MPPSSYAVVAYLGGDLGKFVDKFRSAISPDQSHLRPHITALSPRKLQISDAEAIKAFKKKRFQAVAIELGDVCSFRPLSPTIYLDLRNGQQGMWELHRNLGAPPLLGKPDWPYAPHVTLAKLDDFKDVARVFQHARDRWADYQGARELTVGELVLVREETKGRWVDLASIHAAD
ncbi:MAG: 2'-5' RNA ligase family protein [Terriglobales bacterium]|jgi:2'-5' RNA ligase